MKATQDFYHFMDNNLNLELRSEVLGIALEIEEAINNLLNTFLLVNAEKPKAITNRSSSLSFKNKIDLLFDIGTINKLQHENFLLLMEIRNQFMHNSECNSFEIAIQLLNREKQLMVFSDADLNHGKESALRFAYQNLHINCLDIVIRSYEKRRNKIQEKNELLMALVDYASTIFRIDEDIFNKILLACEADRNISVSDMSFRLKISDIITNGHKIFETDQLLKENKDRISELLNDPDYIKNFFRSS